MIFIYNDYQHVVSQNVLAMLVEKIDEFGTWIWIFTKPRNKKPLWNYIRFFFFFLNILLENSWFTILCKMNAVIYMYVYIYVCIYICMYIYVYTHITILVQVHVQVLFPYRPPHIDHWVDFPVLDSRHLFLICFICSSVYMLIPRSYFIPPANVSPLVTISMVSKSLSLFLFCE